MQGVGHDDTGILVLGATNLPWALDPAIRRRFEKRIYIPLADIKARVFMVKFHLKGTKNTLMDADIDEIAEKTDGFSGADISILVRDAIFEPVRLVQTSNYFREIMIDGNLKLEPVGDQFMN